MQREEIARRLKRLGIRVTRQRLAVAEVLVNSEDHPTAQEVYQRVRAVFPDIALATIYNTIGVLIECGFIQSLSFGEATRYDANPNPHVNLVCVRCGGITDAPDDAGGLTHLRERVCARVGFQPVSQRVDIYGVCARCRDASAQTSGAGHRRARPALRR
ncbi:MAG TPA: Fur family transcriptional regulator [Dehalococcoidia bacterium]|nr:Fur family transcriptional regulator [Dehalococcoidia bacterium]